MTKTLGKSHVKATIVLSANSAIMIGILAATYSQGANAIALLPCLFVSVVAFAFTALSFDALINSSVDYSGKRLVLSLSLALLVSIGSGFYIYSKSPAYMSGFTQSKECPKGEPYLGATSQRIKLSN
ncbi:hypothetical protein OTK49_03220 [Vibrio coralliirubri]|uniref:hypothetical protein n=1 Tax=Vibrio coralliirubri TaxID=1516159 RepID=UPI0022835E94|nr:hypothetical protein [Vibrio coralliirubri]MCY9861527.1 hypothetical protein [Vibrio coralliirubri]